MRARALFLLVLLLLVCVARATDPAPCTTTEWWAFAQRDSQLAFLYRHTGATGVGDALTYYAALDAAGYAHPYWPVAWQTNLSVANLTSAPVCANARAIIASAAAPLTEPGAYLLLSALLRYGAFLTTANVGCPNPDSYPLINALTAELECGCADGDTCATTDDSITWSTTYALAVTVVTLTLTLMAAAIASNAAFLWRATRALQTVGISKKEK